MHATALLIVLIPLVIAVPLNQLYPFGTEEGDTIAQVNDDGETQTNIQTPFPFFGNKYSTIWV